VESVVMVMARDSLLNRCVPTMLASVVVAHASLALLLVGSGTGFAQVTLAQVTLIEQIPVDLPSEKQPGDQPPLDSIPPKRDSPKLDDPALDAPAKIEESPSIPRSKEPLRVGALSIPNTSISGIGTGTTPEDATDGRLPDPMPLPYGPDREAGWSVKTKHWVAPVYCHQPTYYEDVMLEHHGHERCVVLQPVLSGARFYTGIFFTPYLATLRPPLQDIPSTGHYRPGSCAPALRQRAPYDPTAMKVQAAATAAGVVALQP
jgi:hypothetical protein